MKGDDMAKTYLLDKDIEMVDQEINSLKNENSPVWASAIAELLQAKCQLINTMIATNMMNKYEDEVERDVALRQKK